MTEPQFDLHPRVGSDHQPHSFFLLWGLEGRARVADAIVLLKHKSDPVIPCFVTFLLATEP